MATEGQKRLRALLELKNMQRDGKTDPRPGDEFVGPLLKAKVLEITIDEIGIRNVTYTVNGKDADYHPQSRCTVTLAAWTRFVESDEVTRIA